MYSKKLILDFDGTVFRLFANYDLNKVLYKVYDHLNENGVSFSLTNDVFDSFSAIFSADISADSKRELLIYADELITNAEVEALSSGILTEGFCDFWELVEEKKITVGIASNNSEKCIKEFFARNMKKPCFCPIVGRPALPPQCMKPHTYVLEKATESLGAKSSDIVFVGDNIRDYECAKNFNADFIALTPTSKKRERILAKGLDSTKISIVKDFWELIGVLK